MATEHATVPARSPYRRTSLIAGILYVLTFVSIPSLVLYGPVKGADYVLGPGPDTGALLGGLSEIIVALAGIGTAVVLFPVLKKQNEAAALGLVAARILESSAILLGVAVILTIVALRQGGTGTDVVVAGHTLAYLYDRIFLLSQSFMPAVCDLLLGILLFQSRLVPRALSLIGIVGAPVLLASYLAVFTGLMGQHDALAGASALLVAVFEFSLGIWLIVRGFSPQAIVALEKRSLSSAAVR
ncbi:DUF4386 domain-containing protein [Cryobacterium glucosi]|uniref:DUF4386 domain-containing protein n=1 Tax=Cryobacterium glucosi TaxID=1259175 RepID=A0ABY2IT40_9MICO|nr:DUF4386 domain-containing protein [Cryobacterium glucosi]TFC21858.1 DUF4386 domain-containing protein [Cryobacterium glucosi]